MNLKKLLKDNGKIIAGITAILASGGYILNHQMNKIKKQEEVLEIVQSAEFKNTVAEIIENVLNQKGGINSQILDIKNSLDRGKEKMSHLENADDTDYRELNDKITKNRDAGIDRYISNLKEMHSIERRVLERDLKDCRALLRVRK